MVIVHTCMTGKSLLCEIPKEEQSALEVGRGSGRDYLGGEIGRGLGGIDV